MSFMYEPQLPEGVPVHDLTPAGERREALTPETPVVVINRGYETLVRKFDGRDYPLKPHTDGLIKMPYGAALHFQKHCTVPGTRDAASGAEQSYLGILGIDPEPWCQPFSEDESRQQGQTIEALQRDPGEVVTVVNVSSQMASGRIPVGRGQSARKRSGFTKQGQTASGDTVDRDAVMTTDGRTAAEIVTELGEADE